MEHLLKTHLDRLNDCAGRAELRDWLTDFAAMLGFDGAVCLPLRLGSAEAIADPPAPLVTAGLPEPLATLADMAPERNPVLRQGTAALLSFEFRRPLEDGEMHGLAVPVHGPANRFLLFALARRDRGTVILPRRIADSVARRLFLKLWSAGMRPLPERLKPMELACLTWAARGRTSTQIGLLLGIGERNAYYFLSNGARRLGADNRCHAVALAMKQGLIDP